MNTVSVLFPFGRPTIGQPQLAVDHSPNTAKVISDNARAVSKMLAGLVRDESALYSATREWRYDTAGRKFVRLHVLLDEQFSEIGIRLTRLAARSRELDSSWNSTGQGDRAVHPREAVVDGALQAQIIRELLSLHEALVNSLKRVSVVIGRRFHDRETGKLLAELIANHERDAFVLRALLWEAQNPAA